MKKFFTLIIAALFSISLQAQTPLTEAVDFTATDHEGNEINLFEILDGGQYVLIDFFYSTCGGCPEVATNMVDAYYQLGCNEHDVFFMEVSASDHPNSAATWINTYSIPYPTIHNDFYGTTIEGQGTDICNLYQVELYPTLILIAPDRQIVHQDIYPVHSPEDIINPLVQAGIEEHPCDGQEATTLIDVVKEKSTKIDVKFTPNAAAVSYYYMISEEANLPAEAVQVEGTQQTGEYTHTFTGLTPNTIYNIYTVSVDDLGNLEGFETAQAATLCEGGEGMAQIDVTVELANNNGTDVVRLTAEPNDETAEYHYSAITVALYEENTAVALDAIMHDNYPLCDVDVWDIPVVNLNPTADYYVVAIGLNGEGEWGDVCLTPFNVSTLGVSEMTMNNVEIYPNPASSVINIKSDMNGEGQVSLIDMTGRVVKDVNVTDMSNATINVEDMSNGIYFIKIQQENKYRIDKVVIK